MDNEVFNPQSYAIRIEQKLRKHGYATYGSADSIRENPIGYMDGILSHYEKQSDEQEKRALDFWDKYEKYNGISFDKLGEEISQQITKDIVELFNR